MSQRPLSSAWVVYETLAVEKVAEAFPEAGWALDGPDECAASGTGATASGQLPRGPPPLGARGSQSHLHSLDRSVAYEGQAAVHLQLDFKVTAGFCGSDLLLLFMDLAAFLNKPAVASSLILIILSAG